MKDQQTSPTLLIQIRDAENNAAWKEFDQRYRDLILAYCRKRGLQSSDAEDVRQVVMLSLFRRLRGFHYDPARGRFRDYLGQCVRNTISRQLSTKASQPIALDPQAREQESQDGGLDETWEREWMSHHYRMALDLERSSVDSKSVSVFERLLQGAKIREIAQDMQMTEDAVHKVKQRMKARLGARIAKQLEGDL